jgi:hypothetical protein
MRINLWGARRWLPVSAAVVAVLGLGGLTAAGASTTSAHRATPAGGRIIDSPAQLIEAGQPLPPVGTKAPGSGLHPAQSVPPVPTETVHGDVLALQSRAFYQAGTAQDRNVTVSQCARLFGGGNGNRVINQSEYCWDHNAYYLVLQGGKVIGRVTWFQVTAGNANASGRGVRLATAMENIKVTGEVTDGLVAVNWGAGGYSASDGSNPPCKVTSDPSNPTLLSQWQAGGIAHDTISSDSASGYGRDHVSRCEIQSFVLNTGGYSRPFATTGTRADSASYLTGIGAIFDRVVPVFFGYSLSSPINKAVARHIYDAQTNPGSTYPPKTGKKIPGAVTSGRPLTRLYPSWNAAAAAQYKKNRSVAIRGCQKLKEITNPPKSDQCDEYPFASTWQGAGKGNGDYSLRYVPGIQNMKAGSELSTWYGSQRILERDLFFVTIQP